MNAGHYYINASAASAEGYSFGGFKRDKWYLGCEFALGGTFARTKTNDDVYGAIPLIKSPIQNAKIVRENAKPKITSFSSLKPVIGSVLEISGSNFRAEEERTSVFVDDVSGELISISDDKMSVRIPGNIQPGNAVIKVKTSKGFSGEENIFIVPAKPPAINIADIELHNNSTTNTLSAGESGELTFTVSNVKGAGKAFGLKLAPVLSGSRSSDLNYPRFVDIGDLDSGESRLVTLPLNAGLDLETGELSFSMRITETNDFAPDPFVVKIQTKKLSPPDLILTKAIVDDQYHPDRPESHSSGNGNGVVEPGEIVEVSATLLNQGIGQTKDTKVEVIANSPDIVFYSATGFLLGDIQSQNRQELKFAFLVKKSYMGPDSLPVKLAIRDGRERFNKELPIYIELKHSSSMAPVTYMPKPVTYKIEDMRIPRGSDMAVAELVAKNVSQEEASKATDFLRTELVNTKMYNVTDRSNMETVLAEQKFQSSGYTNQERAIEMGKLLNVKLMFAGSLSKINGSYYITIDVINVETGKIVASEGEEASSFGKLKGACEKLVNKILH